MAALPGARVKSAPLRASVALVALIGDFLAMYLEDELVGMRRRRANLERALLHLDDTLAITLIKAVIEDMDARIAALTIPPSPCGPPL
jgi:hypothetical protein